jgi:uncharacterized damage-inducible protein DinB
MPFEPIHAMFDYNDWANERILHAARPLNETQLDQSFDMGRGSPRRTLLHIYCGELVWLARWQGKTETPWPDEEERVSVAVIAERWMATRQERKSFMNKIDTRDYDRVITYRDSKGQLYRATLGDMILQMLNHSAHHRAQAVNMLRRVNAGLVELDYMYRIRQVIA